MSRPLEKTSKKGVNHFLHKLLLLPLMFSWIICLGGFFFIVDKKKDVTEELFLSLENELENHKGYIFDEIYLGISDTFDNRMISIIKRTKKRYSKSGICIELNTILFSGKPQKRDIHCSNDDHSLLVKGESTNFALKLDNKTLANFTFFVTANYGLIDVIPPLITVGLFSFLFLFSFFILGIYWQVNKNLTIPFVRTLSYKDQELEKKNKELEEKNRDLQKLDKLKDEFLTNTTHELRNPLNTVIGLTEAFLNRSQETLSPKNHPERITKKVVM